MTSKSHLRVSVTMDLRAPARVDRKNKALKVGDFRAPVEVALRRVSVGVLLEFHLPLICYNIGILT